MNTKSIRNHLSKLISGNVLWDNDILNYYSVDSSSYLIKPKVVVIPRNTNDVKKVIKFASKNKIPVTARGAGTGLVGSAIGNGIILDLKNFNEIKVLKDSIVVGSGVLKGEIDNALKKHKKFFPVNPSIGPYCAIGGMIGANASGTRTIKYGAIIDDLLEVTIIDGKGELITLPKNTKTGNEIFSIAKTIDKTRYPNVTKNSCGYRLDSVSNIKKSHKIIAGSEGTLGIIISAKLQTFKIPPSRYLIILGYDIVSNAIKDCQSIVKLKPSALEFVDQSTLGNIDHKFSSQTKCLLFVEFDSELKTKSTKITNKQDRERITSDLIT